MMTKYQVQSRFKDGEWLDDHMPFDSIEEAKAYISTQYHANHRYRIIEEEYPETDSEWLEFNDTWDAVGGDWEG